MRKSRSTPHPHPGGSRSSSERGNVVLFILVVTMLMGALASSFLVEGIGEVRSEAANQIEMALLDEAESALHYNYVLLETDPLYPVKDTAGFSVDATQSRYTGTEQSFVADGAGNSKIRYAFQYLDGTTPVLFADRNNPTESFTQVLVFTNARKAWAEREVVASYAYQISEQFGGAIISDMLPTGQTGLSPKSQSQAGDIVMAGKGRDGQHYLFGNLKANGAVRYYQDKTQTAVLDSGNASSYLGSFQGNVDQGLGGTADEIPDFTALGGGAQLFDFDRFQALAAAGGGTVYSTLQSFVDAMNTANGICEALEGVIVLDIDSAAEGNNPKIKPSGSTPLLVPGGIRIRGTLLFKFKDGTPANYKVFIETALDINRADISGLSPSDQSTYTTGYPASYSDPSKAPWAVDISPAFSNFEQGQDLPALMFNTGIVDIHGPANVCGVVYGPSFIEIENKNGNIQYFNGAIIGGAGVYLEGHSTSGYTAVRHDGNTLQDLETNNNMGKVMSRTGFAVVK